jgi:hypothetical protein
MLPQGRWTLIRSLVHSLTQTQIVLIASQEASSKLKSPEELFEKLFNLMLFADDAAVDDDDDGRGAFSKTEYFSLFYKR